MAARPDLAALLPPLEAVAALPAKLLPGLVAGLAALQARAAVRLTVPAVVPTPTNARPDAAEWLTAGEVASWLGWSDRTVRRRMRDGSWRRGEHWFRQGATRPRFKRSALEAWLHMQGEEPPALGLAYGPDIPRGRRRRLTSLRNKATTDSNGATAGAEADGAAGRVPGACAPHGAARSD